MLNNKKILYLITKSNFGGAGKYVFDLAQSAKESNFDVVVACGGEGLLVDKLKEKNIRTITIPNLERDVNIFKEFVVLKTLISIFKNESPDIVHLNSSKIGGIGALAGRIAKVPKIIFTAHGWAFNEERGLFWKTFTYLASLATSILSHTVITISQKEQMQAFDFPFLSVGKVKMIYNGIKEGEFKTKKDARTFIEKSANITMSNNIPVIGSVGELHKNKGYIYALKMCEQLLERRRDFLYLIIGEGEERYELEKYIREKSLESNVKLLGAIPDVSSGSSLMKAFDIFLLPSTKEGLPYVLLEAAQAKLPVVATAIGGIPEIVEHKDTGLLAASKNEGALTIQIEKILFDERIRRDYGEKNYQNVSNKFTFDKMVEDTLFEYLN